MTVVTRSPSPKMSDKVAVDTHFVLRIFFSPSLVGSVIKSALYCHCYSDLVLDDVIITHMKFVAVLSP